jgi:hypothetical protein
VLFSASDTPLRVADSGSWPLVFLGADQRRLESLLATVRSEKGLVGWSKNRTVRVGEPMTGEILLEKSPPEASDMSITLLGSSCRVR